MKKLIFSILLLTFPILGMGQTQDENYVKTTAYRIGVTETETAQVQPSDKVEQVSYVDGLGRSKQTISIRAGGDKQNIHQYVEYDAISRVPKQYLPFATQGEVANPLELMDQTLLKAEIESFYNTPKYEQTLNPYSEMVYEDAPLNRVFEQAAPGNSWALSNNHTIKTEYLTNTTNEVFHFEINYSGGNAITPQLVYESYYPANELSKTIIKDENWVSGMNHTTQEFINKEGQIVLKRSFNEGVAHNTYYVYDDYGNLSIVLSPEASAQIVSGSALASNHQDILDKFGYQYKYDYRNRLVEKKIPGKGWEYIVYDKLDRPIMIQDANQRAKSPGEWLFTKYDVLGRVVYTGIRRLGGTRSGLQTTANNDDVQYEERTPAQTTIAGVPVYYTNNATPGAIHELLTVNYYDDYIDTAGMSLPLAVYGVNPTGNLKSLPTVSKVRILGSDQWITTITGYDEKARPIYIQSNNSFLGTDDTVTSLLDFTGNVLESTTLHNKAGHNTITTIDYFTYDHQNRLLNHKQQINDEPLQLIAHNFYDELGRLTRKGVGGETTFDGYVDIVNVAVAPDGTMSKNHSGGSSLKTKGVVKDNGGIEFVIANDVYNRYRVGLLNPANIANGSSYFNYSIQLQNDNVTSSASTSGNGNGIRDDVRVVGVNVQNPTLYAIAYQQGDTFRIERIDNVIHFKHNGQTFHTETVPNFGMTYIGKVVLQTNNAVAGEVSIFGDHVDKCLQYVDYAYNVRGWLTDINNVNEIPGGLTGSLDNDLFKFRINYDAPIEGDAGLPGRAAPLYNGNISQTSWRTANDDNDRRGYGYKYDALNRFKTGYSRKGNDLNNYDHFNVNSFNYDRNGNILALTRQGENENHNALNMDDLNYTYDGNQLLSVNDTSTSPIANDGFYDGNTIGDDYDYDANGNMTEDRNKGIQNISYNYLNLPTAVTINGTDAEGNTQIGTIAYIYDAAGTKLQKRVTNSAGITRKFSYAGGYIYEKTNPSATEELMMIPHPEGYVAPVYDGTNGKFQTGQNIGMTYASFSYAFNYTDHLGNVRLTYSDADGDGFIAQNEIISEKHYYPFGLQHRGYNNVVSANKNDMAERFAYANKESNPELGLEWIDFGWRNYNPSIGRWMNIDPLADKFYNQSTFNYVANSPMILSDPDGRDISFSIIRGDNGEITDINITVTGKIINDSRRNLNQKQLGRRRDRILTGLSNIQVEGEGVNVSFSGNIEIANSESDISKTDHVFRLVDNVSNVPGVSETSANAEGFTPKGQNVIYLENDFTSNTAAHEVITHSAGLKHINQSSQLDLDPEAVSHFRQVARGNGGAFSEITPAQASNFLFQMARNRFNDDSFPENIAHRGVRPDPNNPGQLINNNNRGNKVVRSQVRTIIYNIENGNINKGRQR